MKLSLLIVDDNKDFSEILSEYIEYDQGLEITISGVVDDGVKALDLIEKSKPDIIILDMIMPKLDGMGVLIKLQEMKPDYTPKIIISTGYTGQRIISDVYNFDIACYIVKPFEIEYLISEIKEIRNAILEAKVRTTLD